MFANIASYINSFSANIASGEFSLLLLLAAFLGGVLSSLSPCTLGILPIIVGYVGGYGDKSEKSVLITFFQMLSFVLGLSLVLTIIGVLFAIGGKVFTAVGGEYFVLFLASIILILGLNLTGLLELNFPVIVKQMPSFGKGRHFLYPFIVGIFFALAATPCSTPILAGIISFAALSTNIAYAALLLFLFAMGQGLIIILVGISTSLLKNLRGFAQTSEILMKICGVLLILSSLFLYSKVFSRFFI
jgi:cytochrome c-type biogenesis protein